MIILKQQRIFIYTENIEDIKKHKTVNFIENVIDNNDTKKKTNIVNNFINNFNREFKRQPTSLEVFDNLKENINDDDIINNVISDNK